MFFLFGGSRCYYSRGGAHDFIGQYTSVEEAAAAASTCKIRDIWMDDEDFADADAIEWWHVVDAATMSIVTGTRSQPYGACALTGDKVFKTSTQT